MRALAVLVFCALILLTVPNRAQSTGRTPATTGLTCIQDALGGAGAIAKVASLQILSTTKVTVAKGPRPMALAREISVEFPDRFKIVDVQTDMPRGSKAATLVKGFNGDVPLSNLPPPPNEVPTVGSAHRRVFVHELLMRLPRELPGIRLWQRTTQDNGQERLAIDASGVTGLNATLLADPRTCLPIAFQYTQPNPFTGLVTQRVALSQYRRFGGILFPTVLRATQNGNPWNEEYVSEVRVNGGFPAGHFRSTAR